MISVEKSSESKESEIVNEQESAKEADKRKSREKNDTRHDMRVYGLNDYDAMQNPETGPLGNVYSKEGVNPVLSVKVSFDYKKTKTVWEQSFDNLVLQFSRQKSLTKIAKKHLKSFSRRKNPFLKTNFLQKKHWFQT